MARPRTKATDGGAGPRLILVVTAGLIGEELLARALAGGDVAAVILARGSADAANYETYCIAMAPVVQQHGVAAIVCDDARVMGRSRADGIFLLHSAGEVASVSAQKSDRPILGLGGITTRHHAMLAGEHNPDFVLFGHIDGDIRPDAHPKNLALANWWASFIEIPCIAMAGHDIESVAECAATGAEFIAVSGAVWNSPSGPDEAVRRANEILRAAPGELAMEARDAR
jgi:thiamine-phosphate pyrophosphorylase